MTIFLPPNLFIKGLSQLGYVHESIKQYLMTQYTERGPRTSCDTGVLTNRMRDKILASLIILGLMLNGYTLNTDVLQHDLKAQSAKYVLIGENKHKCTYQFVSKNLYFLQSHFYTFFIFKFEPFCEFDSSLFVL